VKATHFLVLLLIAVSTTWGDSASGYQTRFPSAVGASETVPPPGYGAATTPSYGSAAPPPSTTIAPGYGTTTVPSPSYGTPVPGAATPVTPGQVPGPVPSYGTAVETPPPTWDPYAAPGSTMAPTLLPQDYYPPAPTTEDVGRLQRLIDEIRMDYHFLAARGSKKFGTNDLELSTTVAFPFLYNRETPLFVTPGFAFHWWQGPTGTGVPTGLLSNLPPRVYDAYLGAAWNPQVTPQLGGELAFRVGVYSDFERVRTDSLRYTGHGLLTLSLSPSFKVKGGIVYYDRIRIKMLPAAGFVWTPNPDTEFDIFFPSPRISRRLMNYGNTEWWLYCRGEYGGGSWVVEPDDPAKGGTRDQVDYNDLRFAIGLEFDRMDRIGGLIEVGTAFDRELLVRSTGVKFSPSTTIFLRAGLLR